MSQEVEVKLRISNVKQVEEKLRGLGAKLVDVIEEEDHYIDLAPCINMRDLDIALRVRKSRSLVKDAMVEEMTFKGRRVSEFPKIRKEITVNISNVESVLEIFRELGFRNIYVVSKTRKVYVLNKMKIFLDSVKGLGQFMEVELLEPTDLNIFRDELAKLFTAIGVDESYIERKTYLELVLEKKGFV